MKIKSITIYVAWIFILLLVPIVSADLNYTTLNSVFNNFLVHYNSEGFFRNISNTIIGNINGTIDDVMIFNRSLSADEILSIYNATKYQHTQTNLSDGSHTFKAYTQDLAGNMNNSGLIQFNVSTTGDTIYPSFSDYYDDNATLLDTGTGHFNVTVKSTNGTVILHINNSNILATNLTNDVYNASYNFTQSGTYLYNWTAYGNGTSTNLNTSINQYYVVNSSVSNCWTKTGTGRGSILYTPRGCVYQVLKGDLGL